MENQELIKQVTEKAEKWLTPAYDAETQAEVKRMLENDDKTELIDVRGEPAHPGPEPAPRRA